MSAARKDAAYVANFTPGPWCVEEPMGHELWVVEAGKEAFEWRVIAGCPWPDERADIPRRQVEANARLMASAPEMLAALEEAYRFITQPARMDTPKGGPKTATYRVEGYNALTAKLRAAIAKAGAA